MTDWTAGLDVDDDPVQPSTSERAMRWLANHASETLYERVVWRIYDWWLERRCRSCSLQRFEHPDCVMGGCTAR